MYFFPRTTAGGNGNDDDDDDSKNDHRKKMTKIAGKNYSFFTGIWNKNGVNFKKKMDEPLFVLSILINQIKFVNVYAILVVYFMESLIRNLLKIVG